MLQGQLDCLAVSTIQALTAVMNKSPAAKVKHISLSSKMLFNIYQFSLYIPKVCLKVCNTYGFMPDME